MKKFKDTFLIIEGDKKTVQERMESLSKDGWYDRGPLNCIMTEKGFWYNILMTKQVECK
jgi:hypothetical protein